MTVTTPVDFDARLAELSSHVAELAAEVREQRRRRQAFEELVSDLAPIGREALEKVSGELEEVQAYVQPEDLLRLTKRVARNTANIERLLVQLEALSELVDDAAPLARDVFDTVLRRLDELEQRGYLGFARGGAEVMDRVVTSFGEEDVRQLGDNIVLILETVKEMTQPEVMLMLRRTAHSVREEDVGEASLLSLARQLRQPEVKRGLARLLAVLRSMGTAEPTQTSHQANDRP